MKLLKAKRRNCEEQPGSERSGLQWPICLRKKNGSAAAAAPRQQPQGPDYRSSEKWIGCFCSSFLQLLTSLSSTHGDGDTFGPVEEEDVVGAGQSLQQDLLLRDGLGRVELHPDELPHVLVHQADAGAVDDVSDVGWNPVNTRVRCSVTAAGTGRGNKQPQTGDAGLQDQSGVRQEAAKHIM